MVESVPDSSGQGGRESCGCTILRVPTRKCISACYDGMVLRLHGTEACPLRGLSLSHDCELQGWHSASLQGTYGNMRRQF